MEKKSQLGARRHLTSHGFTLHSSASHSNKMSQHPTLWTAESVRLLWKREGWCEHQPSSWLDWTFSCGLEKIDRTKCAHPMNCKQTIPESAERTSRWLQISPDEWWTQGHEEVSDHWVTCPMLKDWKNHLIHESQTQHKMGHVDQSYFIKMIQHLRLL